MRPTSIEKEIFTEMAKKGELYAMKLPGGSAVGARGADVSDGVSPPRAAPTLTRAPVLLLHAGAPQTFGWTWASRRTTSRA